MLLLHWEGSCLFVFGSRRTSYIYLLLLEGDVDEEVLVVVVLWQHYLAFQHASVAALLGLPVCFCGSTTWPSSMLLWQHYLAFQYASVAALLGLPVCFCGSTTWPSSMLLWQHYLAFQYASVAALLGLPVCFCDL